MSGAKQHVCVSKISTEYINLTNQSLKNQLKWKLQYKVEKNSNFQLPAAHYGKTVSLFVPQISLFSFTGLPDALKHDTKVFCLNSKVKYVSATVLDRNI